MPGSAVAGSADARNAAAAAAVKTEAANGDAHASTAAATAGGSGGPTTTMSLVHPQQHVLSPLAALAAGVSSTQHHQQQQRQKPPLVPGSMQSRRAGDFVLQGLQSPLPSMGLGPPGPQTPISQAMGSVSWLRSLAQGLTAEPSAALQRYMQAAGTDAGPVLVERVQAAAEAVFMSDAAGDPVLAGGLQGLQHGLAQERQTQVGWLQLCCCCAARMRPCCAHADVLRACVLLRSCAACMRLSVFAAVSCCIARRLCWSLYTSTCLACWSGLGFGAQPALVPGRDRCDVCCYYAVCMMCRESSCTGMYWRQC